MNAVMVQAHLANAVSRALANPANISQYRLDLRCKSGQDYIYASKTSLRTLRKNLEMVRQGDFELMKYYGQGKKKLTLVTNKVFMSHDPDTATNLNKEVRDDPLHALMAALKKSLKSLVLLAKLNGLPPALALSRETENIIERSTSYANAMEDKSYSNEGNSRKKKFNGRQWKCEDKIHTSSKNKATSRLKNLLPKHRDPEITNQNKVHPMEVDPPMGRFR